MIIESIYSNNDFEIELEMKGDNLTIEEIQFQIVKDELDKVIMELLKDVDNWKTQLTKMELYGYVQQKYQALEEKELTVAVFKEIVMIEKIIAEYTEDNVLQTVVVRINFRDGLISEHIDIIYNSDLEVLSENIYDFR